MSNRLCFLGVATGPAILLLRRRACDPKNFFETSVKYWDGVYNPAHQRHR